MKSVKYVFQMDFWIVWWNIRVILFIKTKICSSSQLIFFDGYITLVPQLMPRCYQWGSLNRLWILYEYQYNGLDLICEILIQLQSCKSSCYGLVFDLIMVGQIVNKVPVFGPRFLLFIIFKIFEVLYFSRIDLK